MSLQLAESSKACMAAICLRWMSVAVLGICALGCGLHMLQAIASDSDGCLMSYMHPQYNAITDELLQHRQYTLEAYRDGMEAARPGADFRAPAMPARTMPMCGRCDWQKRPVAYCSATVSQLCVCMQVRFSVTGVLAEDRLAQTMCMCRHRRAGCALHAWQRWQQGTGQVDCS
jgi:hypothetical protein